MITKFTKLIISLIGGLTGFGIFSILQHFELLNQFNEVVTVAFSIFFILLFAIIFFLLSNRAITVIKKIVYLIEKELDKYSFSDLLLSAIGLIIGLIIAYFITRLIVDLNISFIGSIISIIIYVFFGYLGMMIPYNRKTDIRNIFESVRVGRTGKEKSKGKTGETPKILDTSAIIDGRIKDICMTRFVEGPLVIPQFVLQELQHIADSSDGLKRNRGRRGLDTLKAMQNELPIDIVISDAEIEEDNEVDIQLLKYAQKSNGYVITTDYNLNKLADVQGIVVLNINELANAIKTVLLPGEELVVQVLKDGKEANQGIAYMDDGTMIVVENGKRYIGDTIDTVVTSVLQTPAGRMIFVKPVI